jgi:hypothetical protein
MVKKTKKKKMENKAKIRRRLLRLWHDKVMLLNGDVCAVSGIKNGEMIGEKPAILDAHHIEGKECNPSLRFDALNGISLTKSKHKFGRDSFHKAPVWAAEWLRQNRPEQYAYVLSHRNDLIDLDDREVLYAIEAKLKEKPTEDEIRIVNAQKNVACELHPSSSEILIQSPESIPQSAPHEDLPQIEHHP